MKFLIPVESLKKTGFVLAAFVLLVATACDKKNPSEPAEEADPHVENSVDMIIQDSYAEAHEGFPHGVPLHYSWAKRPEIDKPGTPPDGWTAFTGWGQIYEWRGGSKSTNTRVEIDNMKAWFFHRIDKVWVPLQDSDVEGAYYAENFIDDVSKPGDIRVEPNGNVSVVPGGGYNFHFWPSEGRVRIPSSYFVKGVYITFRCRLILDDPDGPDDRAKARFLMSAGGDYWLSLTAAWDNWETNGGIGVGRFKFVTNDWLASNCCTLPAVTIRSNPPPPFNESADQ